jgi:hypothetical protein
MVSVWLLHSQARRGIVTGRLVEMGEVRQVVAGFEHGGVH